MIEIAVLGANGMLGNVLSNYFEQKHHRVTRLTRDLFEVSTTSLDVIEKEFHGTQFLINCIVNDPRSDDFKKTIEVNALFPRRLAHHCSQRGIKLIHISTNGVFSGAKGNYCEDDLPDAVDLYGISKFLGEAGECMVLRTSIIGTEKCSSKYLLQWAISQQGKQVQGLTNHYWNGITTLAMARAIESIFENNLYTAGVFHVHSNTTVNKCELLSLFDEVYALDLRINPVTETQKSDRTLSSIHSLSSQLIKTSVHQQLEELKSWEYGG